MNRGSECEVFGRRLDELVDGTLTKVEADELRRHAEACPECRAQLAVREHLAGLSRRDLVASVPAELADSVWPAVKARIGSRGPRSVAHRPRAAGWLVPILAAASFALLVGCGYLLVEVGRLRERGESLARQVEQQERWLDALDAREGAGARARTAALGAGSTWERLLARRSRISVGELREMLAAAPPELTVIDASRARELRRELPLGSDIGPALAGDLLDTDDGLQAGELLRLLDELEVDPAWSVAVSRILGERGVPAAVLGGGGL